MSETNFIDDICAICRNNFKKDDETKHEIIKKLPCGHFFHNVCINIFVKNNKCPICRHVINKKKEELLQTQTQFSQIQIRSPEPIIIHQPTIQPITDYLNDNIVVTNSDNANLPNSSTNNLQQWQKERIGYIPNINRRKELLEIRKKNESEYEKLKQKRPKGGSGILEPSTSFEPKTREELRKLRLQKIKKDEIKLEEKRKKFDEKWENDKEAPIIERKKKAREKAKENEDNIKNSSVKLKKEMRKHYENL